MQARTCDSVLELIGNTPLIRLRNIASDIPATVYAKVEGMNPGLSAKDRIAMFMIEQAEAAGRLQPGGTIVEATSGNTGYGIAMVSAVKGYNCILCTKKKTSKEKIQSLEALGAKVIICPSVGPDDPRYYVNMAKRLAAETEGGYYLNQNYDLNNSEAHYRSTGPEIWQQTEGKITHFVACTSTGGTISGTSRYLKEQNPNIKVVGVDAYGSVLKKYHETGEFDEKEIHPYHVEGLGKTIIPANVNFDIIDRFVKVNDLDSAEFARRLAKEEGLFVGYSSGSAMRAIMEIKDELTAEDVVVVLFSDHGSRYLGKIYNDQWMNDNLYKPQQKEGRRVEQYSKPARRKTA
ncbi:MAG: cysteine synthase family protein [Bacteroidota bacterium]